MIKKVTKIKVTRINKKVTKINKKVTKIIGIPQQRGGIPSPTHAALFQKNDHHFALSRRRREIFPLMLPPYVFCPKFGAKVQGGRPPCTFAPKAQKCGVVG